ncbi:nuclear exosome regulator NRDE2 isoform X2 [Aotus nancymaae]|uniref:nuclear exosome regulator NRDE2 isoform X2 n=1 Tax=Aotus nancymaae TaxID=37293 RepID=UPI0030FECF24
MALFPAFAGVSEAPDSGSSKKELDWLSNPSFCVGSITSLSQQIEAATAHVSEGSPLSRSPLKSEPSDESDTNKKLKQTSRKKKKEKKKRRKHQHHKKTKRKHGQSSSSRSETDTDSEKDRPSRAIGGSKKESEKPNQGNNAAADTGHRFVWLEDIQAVTGETFRTDKKPDPANWEYKSLYRGDIARYKRKGDSCLGINPAKQRISWERTSTEKKHSRKQVERYFTKKSVGLMNIDGVAISSKTEPPSSDPASFIPVKDLEDAAPVTTWLNPLGIYDQSTTQWLQGQGPPEQESKQPDAQPDSESAALKARVEEFNRRVRENPRDTQLWMAFVAFQVEFFEPFWDSGEPRAGEKGARGWKAWMHQQERGGWVVVNPDEDDDEPEEDDQEIKDKTLPRWQIWLAAERSRDQRHWRPWRPDKTKKQSEEDCEDPERQVLFDDIGQSLIRLSNQDLQFQLVEAFLQFLGVPSGFTPPASCLYLAMDENSIFDNGLYDEKPFTFFNPLFSGTSCVGRMDRLGCPRWTRGQNREGEEFIRNIFHLVMPLFSGKEKSQLCFSWLQYEIGKVMWCLHTKNKKRLKSQGKNCKKLAKNLLKEPENRNNFCLWKQYAHLEWLLGNTEDARKVFDTALGTAGSQGLKDSELCELSLLYAELEVELEVELSPEVRGAASARAVHILTKLTESSPYGPYTGQVLAVHILKARKAYEHALQDCLGDSCVSHPAPTDSYTRLISLAKCFMLFQYLTIGIGAAVRIYEQVFAKLHSSAFPEGSGEGNSTNSQSRSSVLEAITLMHASLLRFHMKVSVYPLAPLREALSQALKLYPGNQVLWRSYVQIQNKSHSASKTRRFFDTITRSAKHLEPWLFAIEAEKMRKRLVETVQRLDGREIHATIPETGLTHRIQALFENAMRSDSGSQCPLLWRMYLNFLVSLGNKERSKGVFYKALQNCPWAKVLYLDAVEYFPEEMQEVLDLMTEKELRVRLPLEELELLLED